MELNKLMRYAKAVLTRDQGGLLRLVKADPIPVMTMRVYRAKTGTWEDGPEVTSTAQRRN